MTTQRQQKTRQHKDTQHTKTDNTKRDKSRQHNFHIKAIKGNVINIKQLLHSCKKRYFKVENAHK